MSNTVFESEHNLLHIGPVFLFAEAQIDKGQEEHDRGSFYVEDLNYKVYVNDQPFDVEKLTAEKQADINAQIEYLMIDQYQLNN